MNDKQIKFNFVSSEWVDQAKIILNDLVSRFGEEGISFSDFLWQFVDGSPIYNVWKTKEEVPVETAESKAMCHALKKEGFRFCGPTICYAFMQAVGMVNDHTTDCFRYAQLKDGRTTDS